MYICRQCKQVNLYYKELQLKLLNIPLIRAVLTPIKLTGEKQLFGNGFVQLLLALLLLSQVFFSCRPARHISDDNHILDNYTIDSPAKDIDTDELRTYVRQNPNKRILGFRFHLWLYNMANPEKDGWPHNWLRRIGEEPVVYDPFVTDRSSTQMKQYLMNKGFYKAEVDDTVRMRRKRARVTYLVEAGEPYRVVSVGYNFEDENLRDAIYADTINSLIRPGIIFDVDLLQNERTRIEEYLRNEGYFNFSREHVYFDADTTLGNRNVDLVIGITRFRERQDDGDITLRTHRKYNIGNVFVVPLYNPREAMDRQEDYYAGFDTLVFRDMLFLHRDEIPVKPRVIAQSTYIIPGELYRKENVDLTYNHLFALRQHRLVSIRFSEPPNNMPDSLGNYVLDAWIQLTPFNMQSYTVELEGTNSSGDFGVGGSVLYQHRNLLGGAEVFDFRLKGSVETLNEYYSRSFRNTYEYGAEATLQIPRFMLPIRSVSFVRQFNPRTNLSLAYNYQLRPDYTRTVANAGFGYSWRGNEYTTHMVSPVELNLVRLPFFTEAFDSLIRHFNLEGSFRDHMVMETNYSFIFNNQDFRRTADFVYFRFNAETAGNALAAISHRADRPKIDGHYQLFGTDFAQYFKTDFDIRYYQMLYGDNSLVYRLFAGAGLPYGNSTALPFEKKYFSGGANSIRAWQVRSLGPGSFHDAADRSFPNRTADIKLEANIEYRFELFWLLEGALFLDAGNIWAIDYNDQREGALFRFDSFYKDIAVGTGLGFRFDFSFFVFRLDMGLKLRDPARPEDRRWIPMHRPFSYSEDVTFNIGIGYPF